MPSGYGIALISKVAKLLKLHYSNTKHGGDKQNGCHCLALTSLGVKGGFMAFFSKATQSMGLKKACPFICRSPKPGWHPSLLAGFFIKNYIQNKKHRENYSKTR